MAKARTARQKAALRKAQLASARKRRGRGKKSMTLAQHNRRRRAKGVAYAATAVAVGLAATHVGRSLAKRKTGRVQSKDYAAVSRKKNAGYSNLHELNNAINKAYARQQAEHFAKKYNSAVAHRKSQAKEHRNNRIQERRLRVHKKMGERSMYKAGLSSNVGGRTFVSGRGGTYRL